MVKIDSYCKLNTLITTNLIVENDVMKPLCNFVKQLCDNNLSTVIIYLDILIVVIICNNLIV